MEQYANVFGFAAAAATLASFLQVELRRLRIFALAANMLFILYGWLGDHPPPLLLHVILLPLNVRMLILLNGKHRG